MLSKKSSSSSVSGLQKFERKLKIAKTALYSPIFKHLETTMLHTGDNK